MRDEYQGTSWGYASVARRIYEFCPLVMVGVRNLSLEEKGFIQREGIRSFFWGEGRGPVSTAVDILPHLAPYVYISIDLDVLDPSLMAAVGTPEPGGMDWVQLTSLLRAVAERRRIVGFDVTELSPREGPFACAYTAARLVYKLIAYATLLPHRRVDTRVTGGRAGEKGWA
jgi:agmatinase